MKAALALLLGVTLAGCVPDDQGASVRPPLPAEQPDPPAPAPGGDPGTTPNSPAPVPPANRAPTVGGTPPTVAQVGVPYSFTPTGRDPDGDSLTWSITGKPGDATFSPASGRLTWTPAEAGTWSGIVITATDSRGASTSLPAFSITVSPRGVTGQAALSWSPPSGYTDGSAIDASEIAGYRIYHGERQDSLVPIAEVDGRANTYTVANLAAGTHYFAVTTLTIGGAESEFSRVGYKTIQ